MQDGVGVQKQLVTFVVKKFYQWSARCLLAVQLYTALVYGGISLAGDIAQGLDDLLKRDGFASVTDAAGSGRSDWT